MDNNLKRVEMGSLVLELDTETKMVRVLPGLGTPKEQRIPRQGRPKLKVNRPGSGCRMVHRPIPLVSGKVSVENAVQPRYRQQLNLRELSGIA